MLGNPRLSEDDEKSNVDVTSLKQGGEKES